MKLIQTSTTINQACKLTLDSLYGLHPQGRKLPPDRRQAERLIDYQAHQSANHCMLLGYYHEEKFAGVSFNYPGSECLKLNFPKCPKSRMFQVIAPYEKILENQIERSLLERKEMDKAVILDQIVVSPKMQKEISDLFMDRGWETGMSIFQHAASAGLGLKFFDEVIKNPTIDAEPFQGQKLVLARLSIKQALSKVNEKTLLKTNINRIIH